MRTDFLHKTADGVVMAEEELTVDGAMRFKIAATDAAYLENTYSSSFVNEMAIQITAQIESQMMIEGLAKSDITLQLVFAPGTYMEHPHGEDTYRRLLISESGRAIKDLWIRWRRVGEGKRFTVCDDVSEGEIRFYLGEDVPQKVREKEYRFLVQADADKYRAAMGRKNVTEWREIIKRAVKRGTLTKVTIDEKVAEHAGLIKDKLEEILGKLQPVPQEPEIIPEQEKDEAYERAMDYMRNFVQENTAASEAETEEEEDVLALSEAAVEDIIVDSPPLAQEARETDAAEAETACEALSEEETLEDVSEADEEELPAAAIEEEFPADISAEDAAEQIFNNTECEIVEETKELVQESFTFEKPIIEQKSAPAPDVDALRAEMEKKLREEMLEKEQELLRREYELERKRRELAAEMKAHELSRAEREIELRRQAQNQARLDWEAKERDRLAAQALEAIELRKAEEARIAEEARRAEEARIAEEARKAEEARIAEEARRAEEARIAEEARKAEEARIAEEARRAEEARIAEEARKAEEARIAEEARKAEEARIAEEARRAEEARIAEEARRAEEARKMAAENSLADPAYTYTQKMVHLIFRHPVDPNVVTRIRELMADTIRYFGKEHVFIKVKATIPSENTVDLNFSQFPAEEHKLLVDMIQVLGNSDLGICRVLVD